MPELAYVERATNGPTGFGTATFIDAGTLAVAAGDVMAEFFCPRVDLAGGSGPPHIAFGLVVDGSTVRQFAQMQAESLTSKLAVYGQHIVTIALSGSHTFSVSFALNSASASSGQAICEPPLLPAWFRIVAEPFAEQSRVAAINHEFGLA